MFLLCNIVAECVVFFLASCSIQSWLKPHDSVPGHCCYLLVHFLPILLLVSFFSPPPPPPAAACASLCWRCSSLLLFALPDDPLQRFCPLPSMSHSPSYLPHRLCPFFFCIFTSCRSPPSPLPWSTTRSFHPLPVLSTGVEVMGPFCLKLSPRALNSRGRKQHSPCLCSLLPTQPCCNVVTGAAERRQKSPWLNLSRSLFLSHDDHSCTLSSESESGSCARHCGRGEQQQVKRRLAAVCWYLRLSEITQPFCSVTHARSAVTRTLWRKFRPVSKWNSNWFLPIKQWGAKQMHTRKY